VDADLDTLATALYVRTDDLLKASPERAPWRPRVGIAPRISDAELITLAVMQALLRFTSEARWLRHARVHLRHLFRYLPQQPGYNKRLRALGPTIEWLITTLACDTNLWTDDVWVVDSTPVECGRSRETTRRSDLTGYAEYGYCASHSRYFWGLRLHLIATLHGLPNRVDLRHGQGAARPRRTRRAHHHRRRRPRLPATTRPHRRDLAQRPHPPAHQTITPGLRPLTIDLGIVHLGEQVPHLFQTNRGRTEDRYQRRPPASMGGPVLVGQPFDQRGDFTCVDDEALGASPSARTM
jgi:hypothetical protein